MKIYIIIATLLLAFTCQAQPLVLSQKECREMALNHSEDIKISSNNILQAELDRKVACNSLLPQLNGSAMGMYMLPDMDFESMALSMKGTWTAGLNLTQPIYAGGKIVSGIKLAKLGVEASREQKKVTRSNVIADADNAYWTYIAVLEKQRMLESMLEYINSIYIQVKNSVDVEMATSGDLLRVEAKRSDFNYQLEKVNRGLDMCRMNLCNVIGMDFSTQIVPADTTIMVNLSANYSFRHELIANRPEYKLLQKQIDISQEQIKQVRADYLPTLALSAGYSYFGNMRMKGFADDGTGNKIPFTQRYNDDSFSLMLSLSVPIWNWEKGIKR